MHRCRRQGLSLLFLLWLCPLIWASGINAITLPVADNQQVVVSLSQANINRLFVKGDKIVAINAPSGALSAQQEATGSAYLTLQSPQSFTAFVSTEQGHHFSLLIIPKSEPGQTVALLPTSATHKTQAWEKNSDYQQLLMTLIKSALNHQVPAGYGDQAITPYPDNHYRFGQTLNVVPQHRYQGSALAVMVYQAQNITDQSITLSPNTLYTTGVRALALERQTLAPHQTGRVIEVIASAGVTHA